jgi:Zn-dependent peptidase ImmA (M78 family)
VVDILEQYVEFPAVVETADPLDTACAPSRVTAAARETRTRLALPDGPIPHVVRLLESIGIVVVRLPEDLDPRVDAFSTEAGERPLILLSPLKDDRARSRFDAAHELGHLVMHQSIEPGSKVVEQQANRFASEFLAPSSELLDDLPRKVDWDVLLAAKTKWGLSLAALVYRAHDAGIWGEHAYRRANQHLRAFGYPEQGPLGPPESPSMLGTAMELVSSTGFDSQELARVSRLPLDQITDVLAAGSETRPRIQLNL